MDVFGVGEFKPMSQMCLQLCGVASARGGGDRWGVLTTSGGLFDPIGVVYPEMTGTGRIPAPSHGRCSPKAEAIDLKSIKCGFDSHQRQSHVSIRQFSCSPDFP